MREPVNLIRRWSDSVLSLTSAHCAALLSTRLVLSRTQLERMSHFPHPNLPGTTAGVALPATGPEQPMQLGPVSTEALGRLAVSEQELRSSIQSLSGFLDVSIQSELFVLNALAEAERTNFHVMCQIRTCVELHSNQGGAPDAILTTAAELSESDLSQSSNGSLPEIDSPPSDRDICQLRAYEMIQSQCSARIDVHTSGPTRPVLFNSGSGLFNWVEQAIIKHAYEVFEAWNCYPDPATGAMVDQQQRYKKMWTTILHVYLPHREHERRISQNLRNFCRKFARTNRGPRSPADTTEYAAITAWLSMTPLLTGGVSPWACRPAVC
jgi:hypothetical protein